MALPTSYCFGDLLPGVDEKLWTANLLLLCLTLLKWKLIPKYVYDMIFSLHSMWVDPKVLGRFLVFNILQELQTGKLRNDLKSALIEYSEKPIWKNMKEHSLDNGNVGKKSSLILTPKGKKSSLILTPEGKKSSLILTPEGKKSSLILTPKGKKSSLILTPKQFFSFSLTSEHIEVLLNGLVDVYASNKWEEIGNGLGLPRVCIEKCREGDMQSKLQNVFSLWVSQKYRRCRRPTLTNLKKVLCSDSVQLNAVAESMHMIFKEMLEPGLLELLSESSSSLVVEGRPTLLECRHNSDLKVLSYRWFKDGIPLCDNGFYLGTACPFLVILKADHVASGLYCCRVLESDKEWYSKPLKVNVIASPIKNHLLKFYSQRGNGIVTRIGPLKTFLKYTDLTLLNTKSEIEHKKSKSIATYQELFTHYKPGMTLVLVGRVGSGKSCLANKVVYDWAVKDCTLKHAKFVFLVSLKDFPEECNLSMVLRHIYKNEHELELVLKIIEASQGNEVCFILDGLEKYLPKTSKKSQIYDLIRKQYLPKSMVIVTSRSATDVRKLCPQDNVVEVSGFSQQKVLEFVKNYPFNCDSLRRSKSSSEVCSYLTKYSNVLSLCNLPLHLAIICQLYQQKNFFPLTETALLYNFTRQLLSQVDFHGHQPNCTLKKLPDNMKQDFKDICSLGFSCSFPSADDSRKFTWMNTMALKTGLVEDVSGFTASNAPEFRVVHASIQDFLAALHIAGLSISRQVTLMMRYLNVSHVWKYYFGIVAFNDKLDLISVFIKCHRLQPQYLFQCAYESQQPIVCEAVARACPLEINLRERTPTLAIETVFYVLSVLSKPAITLNCQSIGLEDEAIKSLAEGLKLDKSILALNLSFSSDIISNGAGELCESFKHNKTLEFLDISSCEVSKTSLLALAEGLNHNDSIKHFDASMNNFSMEDLIYIKKFLNKVHTFIFSQTCFNMNGITVLSEVLSRGQIKHLNLSASDIDSRGMTILAKALKNSHNLCVLNLSKNNIDGRCAREMQNLLTDNDSIEVLDLSRNSIGHQGAQALGCALKTNRKLQTLAFAQNKIGPKGMKHLAAGLLINSTVKSLDLSLNELGSEGAVYLADALLSNKSLSSLNVRENSIEYRGMERFVESLILSCGTIKELDLSWNEMHPDSAKALANWILQTNEIISLSISHTVSLHSLTSFAELNSDSIQKLDISFNSNVIYLGAIENKAKLQFPNIQELDISGNDISDADIAALAIELKNEKSYLVTLKLKHNHIQCYGALLLANGLYDNQTLRHLELSWNSLRCDGAKAIAISLKVNKTLEVLKLDHNDVACAGATAIGNSIKLNDTIKTIDLSWNNINSDGAVALLKGLNTSLQMVSINLEHNCIGSRGLKEITEQFEEIYCFSGYSTKPYSESVTDSFQDKFITKYSASTEISNESMPDSFQDNIVTKYSTNDGLTVVGETCYLYDGKSSEFDWKDLGFKLLFGREAPAQIFCISAAIGGNCELPERTDEFVSGIFRVENLNDCKIPDTTIQMQHCVSGALTSLSFVVSHDTEPPYKFCYYDGGRFYENYGEVDVKCFSVWALVYRHGLDGLLSLLQKNYLATLYQDRFPEQSENQYLYKYYISFIKNCAIFQKCLKNYHNDSGRVYSTDVTFKFLDQSEEIHLALGTVEEEEEGIQLTFTGNATVTKSEIDDYIEERPPTVQLNAKVERTKSLFEYQITLEGTDNIIHCNQLVRQYSKFKIMAYWVKNTTIHIIDNMIV